MKESGNVLQSNSSLEPKEIFSTYKGRMVIETFCQYIKNQADFNDLQEQDYIKEKGLAFIMMIPGQLYSSLNRAIKGLGNTTISTQDILNMARCLKMERKGNIWTCRNKRKKYLEMLEKIGFKPLPVFVEKAGA